MSGRKSVDELKKHVKDAAKALDDFVESMDAVREISDDLGNRLDARIERDAKPRGRGPAPMSRPHNRAADALRLARSISTMTQYIFARNNGPYGALDRYFDKMQGYLVQIDKEFR